MSFGAFVIVSLGTISIYKEGCKVKRNAHVLKSEKKKQANWIHKKGRPIVLDGV